MTKQHSERADVLALKLKGLKVEHIAQKLGITVSKVHSHDREIKKMMAKGDAEELAEMSPEELEFAKTAVSQLLPYMRKSIDSVSKSATTLQSLHTNALNVAERIFGIIDRKLENKELPVSELKELTKLFADTYAVLYNKNGIQIVNLLATGNTEVDPTEQKKEAMRADILAMRKEALGDVIDVEEDNDE